jgi:hypothetical protein
MCVDSNSYKTIKSLLKVVIAFENLLLNIIFAGSSPASATTETLRA